MKKTLTSLATGLLCSLQLTAQTDARLFRFPDVSQTQITFTYANDIWIMPKEGGQAVKLSSPPGVEAFPKFSPDGRSLAFTGNYDGNRDVYVLPVTGGVPQRLTQHGYTDMVVDWTPDGKRIVFASSRESGKERFNQFYTMAPTGGAPEKLPLAYAEFGSYSPDGKQIAVTFRSQAFRSWKRYRGGWKADIHIFDFNTGSSTNISANDAAGDEFPMWHGQYIYFLSDRGQELRMNLWRYNTSTKAVEQLTHFKDYDVHFPSLGPDDIVLEAGGKLYLFQLTGQQLKEVKVEIVTDNAALRPRTDNALKYLQNISISPDGSRVLAGARGDIFSLPAEEGYVKNLTHSSGSAERYPQWSPDGNTIAYWSDASGEYELYLAAAGKDTPPQKVTSYGPGYRYDLYWSPDSKKLAFIDKTMRIYIYDIRSKQTTEVDKALRYMHGQLSGFRANWSPDSRWLTYARDLENQHNAVFLYDYTDKKRYQATSGFYETNSPVFDPTGKYLYLLTNQHFEPSYSDLDNSFIYANTTHVAAISLQKNTPSPLYAKNDTVTVKHSDDDTNKDSDDKKAGDKDKKKDDDKKDKKEDKKTQIDIEGLESRIVLLPIPSGNYGQLEAARGKVIYLKQNNTGATPGPGAIKYYDLEEREEKTILPSASSYQLSADGSKLLVRQGANWAVIKPAENQKIDKTVPLQDMKMTVEPAAEWKELFTDAWRLERDYFYDPNMHGVNWQEVKERYSRILAGAVTREDVNVVIGDMLGELNASHTYYGGGDLDQEKRSAVGYLGIDWEAAGDYYKVKKILRGASWDAEARSPLDAPGVNIKEGSYILAVNGVPLTTAQEPFAAFQDLADKTVEITYNNTPGWSGAKTATVKTLGDEYRLRNLAWIESNRKRVEEATNGDAGYIFVPSTGVDGQNELLRQFNAQWDKKSLVIDERFNNGGQIPDRFIEVLNRKPLAYWAIRDGGAWPWPYAAHFGPKVMLINGWSGSGGDAFPDYFRKAGLGPLIGARTWGGLIGISGLPTLIDGGSITAPSFRMYNPDGTWFKEGYGVDPDIAVDENLGQMAKGIDPQLEKAISTIKELLKTKGYTAPAAPGYEKR